MEEYMDLLVKLLVSEYSKTLEQAEQIVKGNLGVVISGFYHGRRSLGAVAMKLDDIDLKSNSG